MKKIDLVITGSGGILGTEIINQLRGKKFNVLALTTQVNKLKNISENNENIWVCDINDDNLEKKYNFKGSIWINCSFPRTSKGDVLSKSLNYTIDLIDRFFSYGTKLMINISSQSVYKQSGEIISTEKEEVHPVNIYGMTKYSLEKITEVKCLGLGMSLLNIRLGSLAGPNFNQRMINRFANMINKKESIFLDKGDTKLSYLHISDAAEALIRIFEKNFSDAENKIFSSTYNLGNDDWMSIEDIALKCNQVAKDLKLETVSIEYTDQYSDYNNVISSKRLYDEYDWYPKYTMFDIISEICLSILDNED